MQLDEYLDLSEKKQSEFKAYLYPIFTEKLIAAAAQFKEQYFRLDTEHYYQIVQKSRERVYAYELYHLLRNELGDEFSPFYLSGEVDKRHHYLFENHDFLKLRKPDLLLHTPGHRQGDFIVIEIKSLVKLLEYNEGSRFDEVQNDLRKISLMVSDHNINYYRGIFIIYGAGNEELKGFGDICAKVIENDETNLINLDNIDLYHHESIEVGIKKIEWEQFE